MFKKLSLPVLLALSLSISLHSQTVAYITNGASVRVLDTATNTLTANIPTTGQPLGVVFSADGTRAFVTTLDDNNVSVIDTSENAVVATIDVGAASTFLASAPDGKKIYVPVSSNNVQVIDTATNAIVATIPGATEFAPLAVAAAADGKRVYALSPDAVSVIDTATNTVVGSPIPVSYDGFVFGSPSIVVTPAGDAVYVGGGHRDEVSVISTSTNTVTATIAVGTSAVGLAITPDGSKVYVSDFSGSSVFVIDTATNTVLKSIPVGGGPVGVAITPDGASVYVVDFGPNEVSVIDIATNTVVATVPAGILPFDIAIANLSSPFAKFKVEDLDITEHKVSVEGDLTLGAHSGALDFAQQSVILIVGNFTLTIPPGKIRQVGRQDHFVFHGSVSGLKVEVDLQAEHGSKTAFDYSLQVNGVDVDTRNPVEVTLKIGHNTGTTTAKF